MRVEPDSALVLLDDRQGGALVVIERGSARFAVPKRKARPPFVIRAGDTRIEVVGTRFRVERIGDGARVETYEGTVRVWSGGKPILLHRGQHFEPAPAAAATAAEPARAPAAAEPAPRAQAATAPAPRADGPRQRFEQAASLERADPEQALQIYRNLAGRTRARGPRTRSTPRAASSSNAAAVRARSGSCAATSIAHPSGVNASDARALIDQLDRLDHRRKGHAMNRTQPIALGHVLVI